MSNNVKIIKASAGTGKTYNLTNKIKTYLVDETDENGKSKEKKEVESVIATTFTNKAANELRERFRKKLFENKTDENIRKANEILTGNVGTINSIFGKMVVDNAFDLGISPELELVASENVFYKDILSGVFKKYAEDLEFNKILERFSILDKDWQDTVIGICKKCLLNRIVDIKTCKADSIAKINEILPEGEISDDEADKIIKHHTTVTFDGKKPKKWNDWFSALKTSIKEGVKESSELKLSLFMKFPQFKKDHEKYIEKTFDCVSDALDCLAKEKDKRGVIVFTDQETQALELLEKKPEIIEHIQQMYVDEFQDTSPLQLAIFSEMQKQRKNALNIVYVGDPKQSIYAFRGAAPDITLEISKKYSSENLHNCYRSTPEIINFENEMFVPIFKKDGMNEEDIKVAIPDDKKSMDGDFYKSIEIWQSENKNFNNYLANQIIKIKNEQNLTGSDICVLFRNNSDIKKFTEVAEKYFRVSSACGNIIEDEPICKLIHSLLLLMVDSKHLLPVAKILNILECFDSSKIDTLSSSNEYTKDSTKELAKNIKNNISRFNTVLEVVDYIVQQDICKKCLELSEDTATALACLDKYRGIVSAYQNSCEEQHIPATVNGFICWCDGLKGTDNNDEINFLYPSSNDEDAVNVMSIHASKGLEWKVVIVACCERPKIISGKDVFKEHVINLDGGLDVENPLENRSIVLLPWAFSKNCIEAPDAKLDEEIYYRDSETRKHFENDCVQEYDRLMYVALTRAKDKLIICTKENKDKSPEQEIVKDITQVLSNLDIIMRDKDNLKTGLKKDSKKLNGSIYKVYDTLMEMSEKVLSISYTNLYNDNFFVNNYGSSLFKKEKPFIEDKIKNFDKWCKKNDSLEILKQYIPHSFRKNNVEYKNLDFSYIDFYSVITDLLNKIAEYILKGNIQNKYICSGDSNLEELKIGAKRIKDTSISDLSAASDRKAYLVNPSTTKEHFDMDLQFDRDLKIVDVYEPYAFDGSKKTDNSLDEVEEVAGEVNSDLGTMVHLALSVEDLSDEMAENLSKSDYNKSSKTDEKFILSKDDLKAIRKDFYDNIKNVAKGYKDLLKEWPIYMKVGNQLVNGSVDMIALCDDGFYIIDHKILKYTGKKKNNTTGKMEDWLLDAFEKDKVKQYAPEQLAYVKVVKELTKLKCKGVILHLPFQNRFVVCSVDEKTEKK